MEAPPRTIKRARELRRRMTPPELRLWSAIRGDVLGVRFRRQHPIGPYILDFYCDAAKLAVEVDGRDHDFGAERDFHRDQWLEAHGVRTVRFSAEDVRTRLDDVVTAIAASVSAPFGGSVGEADEGGSS